MTKQEFKQMAFKKFKVELNLDDIVEDKNCRYGLKGFVRNKVTKEVVRIVA